MGTRCPHFFLIRVYWVCVRVAVYAGVCACFGRALHIEPAEQHALCVTCICISAKI